MTIMDNKKELIFRIFIGVLILLTCIFAYVRISEYAKKIKETSKEDKIAVISQDLNQTKQEVQITRIYQTEVIKREKEQEITRTFSLGSHELANELNEHLRIFRTERESSVSGDNTSK